MKRVIIEKPSNRTERYEVAEVDFSGRRFLDIRTYYFADGEWKPTKKGVMLPVEIAGALYKGIRKVGKQYFDLLPPPGAEQEAEDKATEKVLKRKKKKVKEEDDEPTIKRSKKKKEKADPEAEKKAKKKKKKALVEEFSPEKKSKKLKGSVRPH